MNEAMMLIAEDEHYSSGSHSFSSHCTKTFDPSLDQFSKMRFRHFGSSESSKLRDPSAP